MTPDNLLEVGDFILYRHYGVSAELAMLDKVYRRAVRIEMPSAHI